ncbi:MAG: hypothetical protein QOE51_3818 [Actinoplanes sp.]|jgi:hypothetical protein|nr:hypothetical protein [Actinoplanes sp.]
MMKRRLGVVAASVAAVLAFGAAPAYAANEVNFVECFFVGGYLVFGGHNSNGTGFRRCFANAGDLNVDFGGIDNYTSGNNAGYFEYEPGDGWRYRHTFPKGENITQNFGEIVSIHIN